MDIKQVLNARAVLTLGKDMTFREYAQVTKATFLPLSAAYVCAPALCARVQHASRSNSETRCTCVFV
eukprot:6298487-Pyramimonas_sp.AAC.1